MQRNQRVLREFPHIRRGCRPRAFLAVAILCSALAEYATADPEPYEPIANPLPDTTAIIRRDSVNLTIGRVRVNQAGYRPQDEKLFYYVGSSASSFDVVDVATGATVGSGSLVSTGKNSSGQIEARCYYKAQLVYGGAVKYAMSGPEVSGTVYKGVLPSLPEGRYRVRVGPDESEPFVVDSRVYSMTKDALLKYYGVARCGDNDSWFHPPCHLLDEVPGGWHDAGDHLKVPQSIGYVMGVLGLCAAAFPDRDTDVYAKNHASTVLTDGIPDVIAELKVGTDYLLTSHDLAGGNVASMHTEIGDFQDHMWWGRPELQDYVQQDRGGPPRPALSGLGGNTAGSMAAGLAFMGKLYAPYDPAYAARCLAAARKIYDYGKANRGAIYCAAMQGGGMTCDELGLAAVALWWATGEKSYGDDLLYDTNIGDKGRPDDFPKGGFCGGWFAADNPGPQKTNANTCWDNVEVFMMWGLYRLILKDQSTALSFGIDAAERLNLIEDILYSQIVDIADVSQGDESVVLPQSSFGWKGNTLSCDGLWGWMRISQDWMSNRYQAGNITELYCYYDIASQMQGVELPNSPGSTDWKADEVKSILLKQLNYMLGMNPWDLSMIVGVGAKNVNHPHHRAASPELQNVPGAFYDYRPPDGALSAGWDPRTAGKYDDWMGGGRVGYMHSEISLDATTSIFLPVMGLAADEPIAPPGATVRIVYVGCDRAIVEIRQTKFGDAEVRFGSGAGPDRSASSDSAGVYHRISLDGLSRGTTYLFDVKVSDLAGRDSVILVQDEDGNDTYFTFTTPGTCPGDAQIANVKVCRVTSDSAEIFWFTPNGEYGSKVVFGESKPPSIVQDGDAAGHPVRFHYMKIGGLKEQTDYWFLVESDGRMDDNDGQYYHFRTPVEHVEFDIRAVRYAWGAHPAIGMNIVNQDVKQYDSLDIRFYFRAKEGLEGDLGARLDIGIVYEPTGDQKHFDDNMDIRQNFSSQRPVKMPDTYDAGTDTYAYYLSLPLWGVQMKSGSRIRLDVILDRRSPWPPYEDLMGQPPEHVISDADWSFGPHSRAAGDPVDYSGIPIGSKNDVDDNYWAQEVNEYICVYRKGEYVWGYSPSAEEAKTKKTHYDLVAQVTEPLNNPSEEYIKLERVTSTMNVRGWATVSDNGVINDIWVNGERLDDIGSVTTYDFARDLWELNIPVKMQNGGNVVDITIFGGPDLTECSECYGCDFSNHHFFVEFSGAQAYVSTMTLIDRDGIAVGDTARIDTTEFVVVVRDRFGKDNGAAPATLEVTLTSSGGIEKKILLQKGEQDAAKYLEYRSALIHVVSEPASQARPNEIHLDEGGKLTIEYRDPTDDTDFQQAWLSSSSGTYDYPSVMTLVDSSGASVGDSGSIDVTRFVVVVKERYGRNNVTAPDSLEVTLTTSGGVETRVLLNKGSQDADSYYEYRSVPMSVVSTPVGQALPDRIPLYEGGRLAICYRDPMDDADTQTAYLYMRIDLPLGTATYHDHNADGVVDRVDVRFSKVVDRSDFDRIEIEWDGSKFLVFRQAISMSGDSGIVIDLSGVEGMPDGIKTGGAMTVLPEYRGVELTSCDVSDRAAPVLTRATYCPGEAIGDGLTASDTLVVEFSEDVMAFPGGEPFVFEGGYTVTLRSPVVDGRNCRLVVTALSGVTLPVGGDSVWISQSSGISDTQGNRQEDPSNRRAQLLVKPRPYDLVVGVGPSPFNPDAGEVLTIRIGPRYAGSVVPELAVRTAVYDAVGNTVAEYVVGEEGSGILDMQRNPSTGTVELIWNGENTNGRTVGGGSYLVLGYAADRDGNSVPFRMRVGVRSSE